MQKRVLLINDMSGVGRCSLTVSVPIISAFGFETSVIPTAVLSTHTGGFEDYTFLDLTDNMLPMAEHWKKLGLHFDMIYCGYLGNKKQVDIVLRIIDMLRSENTTVLVDPVMADFGRLYAHFEPDFPNKLKPLCRQADIIVPNITEACLLTGTEYIESPHDEKYAALLLNELKADLGVSSIVVTGVSKSGETGAACMSENGVIGYKYAPEIEGTYYGSGDVFSSVMCGEYMRSGNIDKAVESAVRFTSNAVKRTRDSGIDKRYGLIFEPEIASISEDIHEA